MQCVFVNTEQDPIRIKRLNLFQYEIKDKKTIFQEICELFYPHPDAPQHAIVSVYKWINVEIEPGTEALAKQAIDAMHAVGKITKLENPGC